MDATSFLVIYGIAMVALLVSLYALLELREAKNNGKHWIDLNRNLIDKVDELEKNAKRMNSPFKVK